MSFFARPHYTSDTTDFLNRLKAEHPEIEAGQREGRAILWDKTIDRELAAQTRAAAVPQKPYPYQTEPSVR